MRHIVVVSTCLLWFLAPPIAIGQADVILVGAKIFTADSNRPTAEAVAIAEDRIQAVGSDEEIRRLAGPASRLVDLRGRTVIPGLMDAHVHLLHKPDEIVDEASLRRYEQTTLPRVMAAFLSHGITTVRSTADALPYIAELRARMDQSLTGPRLVITGPALTSPGGHPVGTICRGSLFCRQAEAREIENEEQGRQAVREVAQAKVDAVKVEVDDLIVRAFGSAAAPLPDSVVAAIADEAHRNGLPVIVHMTVADALPTARRLVALGIDQFVHLPLNDSSGSVSDPADDAEVAAMLAGMDIPVTTTVTNFAPYRDAAGVELAGNGAPYTPSRRAVFNASLATVRALQDAGVKLVVGTDSGGPGRSFDPRTAPGNRTLYEMELLRQAGLSNAAVLTAATANAAEALGILDKVGTITEGKIADLVILDGDLLEDFSALHRTVAVFKGGRLAYGSLPDR